MGEWVCVCVFALNAVLSGSDYCRCAKYEICKPTDSGSSASSSGGNSESNDSGACADVGASCEIYELTGAALLMPT